MKSAAGEHLERSAQVPRGHAASVGCQLQAQAQMSGFVLHRVDKFNCRTFRPAKLPAPRPALGAEENEKHFHITQE